MVTLLKIIIHLRWLSSIQTVNMERKDQRIKLVNEVLNAIRVIKIFAWEKQFSERIQSIRDKGIIALLWYKSI